MAAFTNVVQASDYGGINRATITTESGSLTAGNLVVVLVRGGACTVADTRGNTFTLRGQGGGSAPIWAFSCANCIGGVGTITATFTPATNYLSIVAMQFSGAMTSGEFIGAFTPGPMVAGTTIDAAYNLGGEVHTITVGIADVFANGSFTFTAQSSGVGYGYVEPTSDHNSAAFFCRLSDVALSAETVRATCTTSGVQKNLLVVAFRGVAPTSPAATTRYFMNGGVTSNWSDDTNWSLTSSAGPNNATKPSPLDPVILNAGSPACVIDVAATCMTFNCTGYTNTLTVNANLTTAGNVTLVSGMTLAGSGTGDLCFTVQTTYTSAGKVWPGGIQLFATNGTQFFFGTSVIAGALKIYTPGATGAYIQGTSLSAGGLLLTGNYNTVSTPCPLTLTGGTWSGPGKIETNVYLAGDITISGAVAFVRYTLTYTSGTITTTGSTVTFHPVGSGAGGAINTAGMAFNNITFALTTSAWNIVSALAVTGTFAASSQCQFVGAVITCGTLALSGSPVSFGQAVTAGTLVVSGSSTINGIGSITASSASFPIAVINITLNIPVTVTGQTAASNYAIGLYGTFPWTTAGFDQSSSPLGPGGFAGQGLVGTGTLVVTGGNLATNAADYIEVNLKIAGNVTVVGTVLYRTGMLTYVSGTPTFTGTKTLRVGASATLDTGGMTWANVTFVGTSTSLRSNLIVAETLLLPNSDFTFVYSAPSVLVNAAVTSVWSSTAATTIVSPARVHTAGNTLVVTASGGFGFSITGVTDTAGNTYTKIDHVFDTGADNFRQEMWFAANITGHAANAVTVTWSSAAQYRGIAVIQYSGFAVAPFDGSAKGNAPNTATSVTTGTLTTTKTNTVHQLMPRWGALGTPVYPAGFTAITTGDANVVLLDRLVTGAPFVGTYTYTNTNTSNSKLILVGTFEYTVAVVMPSITCGTLTSAALTAPRTVMFLSGSTVTVTTAFLSATTGTSRWALKTTTPGVTAAFNLQVGATHTLTYTDPTDLNASGGQTILTTAGIIVNSVNWSAPALQARISHHVLEVLSLAFPEVRSTQTTVEVLSVTTAVSGRTTQVVVEVLGPGETVGGGTKIAIWMGDSGGRIWID